MPAAPSSLTQRGAHYVITVKANQPGLHAQLAALLWRQVPVAALRHHAPPTRQPAANDHELLADDFAGALPQGRSGITPVKRRDSTLPRATPDPFRP